MHFIIDAYLYPSSATGLSSTRIKTRARLFERGLSLNLGLNGPNLRLNFKRRLVALFEGRLTLTSGQTAG